jgi:integrase
MPSTIDGKLSTVKSLINNDVDLYNPISVKEYLTSLDVDNGRKRNIINAYDDVAKILGIKWEKPTYKRVRKPKEFIPSEELILQIIASLPGKYPAFCMYLMETGVRSIEAWNLKWSHIDFIEKQVHIHPAKNGNGRTLPLPDQLIAMLHNLQKTNEYVFNKGKLKNFAEGYRRHRKKLAFKLAKKDIMKCSFKTYRDFYATSIYFDYLREGEVKQRLGHRRSASTEPYILRLKFTSKKYVTTIAHNARTRARRGRGRAIKCRI